MPGGRKQDPDYKQVSAHIPKDLILEVKTRLLRRDESLAEAMEQAFILWLEAEVSGELPAIKERKDKRKSD